MITSEDFGIIYKATHDSEIATTAQGKYIPSCCRVAAQDNDIRFESTLETALETGKLQSEDGGDLDIPPAILMEIQAWADELNHQ